jgi:shikimate dehydrogenase
MTVDAKTCVYFLLGNPVSHSFSPVIHNAGFKALASNAVYLATPVPPNQIREAVFALKALAAGGANVTSPYKKAVIPYLDQLADEAQAINSVNTIINREGKLLGYSTDGEGFYRNLKQTAAGFNPERPVLIIGAGGAARAIAFSLACHGLKELYIANRTSSKAERLAMMLETKTPVRKCLPISLIRDDLVVALQKCSLVIYTLPLDATEMMLALSSPPVGGPGLLFFDLRYNPAESELLKTARIAGAETYNGLSMLLGQALLSFKLFTGKEAPQKEMEEALKQAVKGTS